MRKCVLISFLLFLFVMLSGCDEQKGGQEQKPIESQTLVEVIVVSATDFSSEIEATGDLLANESAQLSSETGGIVSKIYFEEGIYVKNDQLLLELINRDHYAALEEARVQMELAEKKYQRNKQLFAAKGISEEMLEESESNYKALKANYEQLQAELNKTQVKAPFEGIIGLRNISQGDYLSTDDSFTTLVDVKPLKIQFSLPEKYTNAIKVGDSISFNSYLSSEEHQAEIYAIDPQIDASTRTFSIKAKYPNQSNRLKPGGFVNVRYTMKVFKETIMIPNQAVVPELEGKKVFLVKNGKAASKLITTGIRKADQIQVLEGLSPGDTIVTSGLLQISEGVALKTRMDNMYSSSNKERKK